MSVGHLTVDVFIFMSYFASKRPGTPEKPVRKNNKTESCKAVWDYGFHSV